MPLPAWRLRTIPSFAHISIAVWSSQVAGVRALAVLARDDELLMIRGLGHTR